MPPIFAQRSRSNYGRGRSRRVESKETDPNSLRNNPVLPKKTLQDKIDELEYKVIRLERKITTLQQDKRILTRRFDEFKLLNSEKEKDRIREAEKKDSMTREEKDRAMGYYPFFPEIVYGPKKHSDEYEKGYTDGYNDAYGYDEVDSWVYNEVDSEVDKEPDIKE